MKVFKVISLCWFLAALFFLYAGLIACKQLSFSVKDLDVKTSNEVVKDTNQPLIPYKLK